MQQEEIILQYADDDAVNAASEVIAEQPLTLPAKTFAVASNLVGGRRHGGALAPQNVEHVISDRGKEVPTETGARNRDVNILALETIEQDCVHDLPVNLGSNSHIWGAKRHA